MYKFLVIQTAFTGDVVLATPLIEKLRQCYPESTIDFLLRKGNEQLLTGHPYLRKVWVWDKKRNKLKNLLSLAMQVRREKYTHVINPHRFLTSGIIAVLSRAPYISGFTKNPLSALFSRKVVHEIGGPNDDVYPTDRDRNQLLIADITGPTPAMPALYPSVADYAYVKAYQEQTYICIAPASVWFTKAFPVAKWVSLIAALPTGYRIYIIGGPADSVLCEQIIQADHHHEVINVSGKLSYLQSAALMQGAVMNYTNDSAPLHFATAMNAPLTAVFCSTIPQFGFGPLRPNGRVAQIDYPLACRPCGLHGRKECPQGHFKCANDITNDSLLWWTSKLT